MKHRIFIAYFLLLAIFISVSQFLGTNTGATTIARLATIESIVERHTYAIDASSLPPTPDKVYVGGHFYGCQPPVLQTAIAPLYFVVRLAGLSMAHHPRLVCALLTIFTVGVLSSLMMALFYGLMTATGLDGRHGLLATATFALGTLVFPYSTVLSAQIIGGTLIFFALYIALRGFSPWRAFFAGVFLGGAATIDIPPGGIFSLLFFLYLLIGRERRRFFIPAVLGWSPPFVLHCIVNASILGTILPAGLLPEYFDYPGSLFTGANLSGVAFHPSAAAFLDYAYHCLVGQRGLFSYNPVLLFPLAALIATAFSHRRGRFSDLSAFVLASIVLTVLYYLLKTVNYGGWAFGMRFFVPLIPAVAVYLGPFLAVRRRLLVRSLFILSLYFSIIVSLIGAMGPWTDMYMGPNPIINNLLMAFGNIGARPPSILPALAMSTSEGDASSLYHLGKKFNLYGWKEHARDAFFMAIRADNNNPAVHISLGNVLCDLRDTSAALKHYAFQLSNHPEYMSGVVGYNIDRGLCVARVSEEDVVARRNMARLLAAEGRPAEARDLLRDYLERGEERFRERCRRAYPEGEIEVVHPASRADLLLLLEHLEQ